MWADCWSPWEACSISALLGLLEALGDAAAGLGHGQLGRVELLLAGHAADSGGFRRGGIGLFLLISGGAGHR